MSLIELIRLFMEFPTVIDGPLAVVGDVHGQVRKLGRVLDRIQDAPYFEDRWVVFVGDFVDRGPATRETLEMVRDFMEFHPRTSAVAGNHDFAMAASLDLIETPEYSDWSDRWLDHYDSQTTFESYGVPFGDLEGLREALPDWHRDFLASLPWVVEHPEYLVVHAGLDPYAPMEIQMQVLRERDFTLNRPQWLCEKNYAEDPVPRDCPQTVVSGHVWFEEVVFTRQKILCDTTGGRAGDLSVVLLPERMVITSSKHEVAPSRPQPVGMEPPAPSKGSWWKFW